MALQNSYMRGYEAVKICEPDEPEEIAKLIMEFYELYKNRMMPIANEEHSKEI